MEPKAEDCASPIGRKKLPPIIANQKVTAKRAASAEPRSRRPSERLIALPDAEKAQDDNNDYDQTDQINDVVQSILLPGNDSRKRRRGARLAPFRLRCRMPWIGALAHNRGALQSTPATSGNK